MFSEFTSDFCQKFFLEKKLMCFTLMLLIFGISACGDSSKQGEIYEKDNGTSFNRLTISEQQRLAPSDLFKSIFLQDFNSFQQYLNADSFEFNQKNDEGETALVVAIKLRNTRIVNALLERANKDHFREPNNDGRSYLSLIVEYDMLESFDKAYNTYKSQAQYMGELWLSYADFKDDLGRRSAFYAKSYAMIDKLENAWFSSVSSVRHYFNAFYFSYDDQGNSFLHLAAQNQNTQIINWYVEKNCSYKEWESSSVPSYLARRVGDFFTEVELSPFRRRFVNLQNDDGNTPIHLAAASGRVESINSLMACYQTDPTIKNNAKRAPIVELLYNVDSGSSFVSEDYKESFLYLFNVVDPAWYKMNFEMTWFYSEWNIGFNFGNNFRKIVTKRDENSWTALHYAAKIRDPYFWDALKDYQKVQFRTSEGFTPAQLRMSN